MLGAVAAALLIGWAAERLSGAWLDGFAAPLIHYAVQWVASAGATSLGFVILLFAFGVVREREVAILPAKIGKWAAKFVRNG